MAESLANAISAAQQSALNGAGSRFVVVNVEVAGTPEASSLAALQGLPGVVAITAARKICDGCGETVNVEVIDRKIQNPPGWHCTKEMDHCPACQ